MSSTFLERIQFGAHLCAAKLGYGLTNYRHPLRQKAFASTSSRIISGTTPLECAELYNAVAACEKIPGPLAEAGVYKGATAAVMLAASASKSLHLFDTFEGLPASENQFRKGDWDGSLEAVKLNLDRWKERTSYHPGLFPDCALALEGMTFSFVHLDLDLYESTIAALIWFWPRITVGGAILSHDYPLSPCVVRAFHEFFDPKPAAFFPLSGHQCLAIRPLIL